GGSGTLFIDKADDLTPFFGRVAKIRHKLEGKKKKIETVNITPFIEGISCSVPCCATKFGTFTGAIQNQIIDIAEVGAVIPGRSGNFAGHDWAYRHFSPDVQHKANQIARQFGDYLYSRGYKGIFGLDLIVDNDNKVWPVECNPRETDAFPLICMLQMEAGAIPMTVFHILEHLSVDYTVPFEETDLSYKNAYSAAQIILYNKFDIPVTDSKLFKAGVYANSDGKLRYLRPGYTLFDLLNTKEFLMTEAITKKTGLAYKPHERIMRLVKRGGILASAGGLEVDVAKSIDLIYKELKFIPIDTGFVDQSGVKTLFANRLIDVKSDPNLAKAKVVNLINDYASGFRRPMKIAWRKHITKSSILEQIKSKRAQKQIKSDIKKIANLGIRIEVIPEIDQAMFAKWFAVYNKMIKAKKYGKLVIDKDWLKAKQKAGRKVGAVVAFKKEKILGGEVFFEVAGRLTVGYGAAAKISELAGGLTLLLDYYFLDYASRQGYDEVSFGQDTNLYGTDLSIGLLAYKVKLGLTPVKANKTYSVTTYFLNFDDFDDPIMFFADKPGGLELTVIAKDQSTTDFKAYLPQNIKECKIFFSSEVVEQNKELF
ncbi:MAG: biotin carboxylase-like protein, partial [uncultured bacterium]